MTDQASDQMTDDVSGVPIDAHPMTYPFDDIPEKETAIEIRPGLFWIRMGLPFSLDHINLWLIEDGDGWSIVDTGTALPKTQEAWETIIETHGQGKPIKRIFVTHYHPDHSGNAGFLAEKYGAELWMTQIEYLTVRAYYAEAVAAAANADSDRVTSPWATLAGFDEDYGGKRNAAGFKHIMSPPPFYCHNMRDGDEFKIGDREFEVIVGRGHAPEHACLYCKEDGFMFSGDQILPRISSNVSVSSSDPAGDPLADWLESCDRLRHRIPGDTLVLPAHNEPFMGAPARLTDLINGHEDGMRNLMELCETPKKAVDVFSALFKREIGKDNYHLATGEALAHLNCLVGRGLMTRTVGDDGAWLFQAA